MVWKGQTHSWHCYFIWPGSVSFQIKSKASMVLILVTLWHLKRVVGGSEGRHSSHGQCPAHVPGIALPFQPACTVSPAPLSWRSNPSSAAGRLCRRADGLGNSCELPRSVTAGNRCLNSAAPSPYGGQTLRCVFYTDSQSGRSGTVLLRATHGKQHDNKALTGGLPFPAHFPTPLLRSSWPPSKPPARESVSGSTSGGANGLLLCRSALQKQKKEKEKETNKKTTKKTSRVWLPNLVNYYKGCKENVLKPEWKIPSIYAMNMGKEERT